MRRARRAPPGQIQFLFYVPNQMPPSSRTVQEAGILRPPRRSDETSVCLSCFAENSRSWQEHAAPVLRPKYQKSGIYHLEMITPRDRFYPDREAKAGYPLADDTAVDLVFGNKASPGWIATLPMRLRREFRKQRARTGQSTGHSAGHGTGFRTSSHGVSHRRPGRWQ